MVLRRRLKILGLGFTALLMPLVFLPSLESAYRLPQLAALALGLCPALAGLALESAPRARFNRVDALAALWFAWRCLTRLLRGWPPGTADFLAEQLCYFCAYLFASWQLGDAGLSARTRMLLLAGLGLGAAYGLAQSLGLDPLRAWAAPSGFGSRSFSSLGNPDFWGGQLALLLPLSLMFWLMPGAAPRPGGERGLAAAWPPAGLLFLLLLSLLLSQTRGAWLGFLASTALAAWWWRGRISWRRLGGLAAAGALGMALLSFPNPLNPGRVDLARRLASSFSPDQGAARGRFFMARAAFNLALEHPLAGVGGGLFTGAYLREQGRMLAQPGNAGQPYRFTHDAHDDWLQTAAECGLPGLLLFAAAYFAALWGLARPRGPGEGRAAPLRASLFAGLAALGVDALFNFPLDIVPTTACFWLLVGWANGLEKGPPDAVPAPRGGKAAAPAWALCLGCLLAAGLFTRSLFADAVFHQGMDALAFNRPGAGLGYLQKCAALRPRDARAWFELGQAQAGLGDVAQAADSYRRAVDLFPEYPEAWSGLGLALGRGNRLPQAEQACQRALALNPDSAQTWGNLGKIHYLEGEAARALSDYRNGLERDPDWAEGWANLGALYFNARRPDLALPPVRRALAIDPAQPLARELLEKMGGGA